MITTTRTRGADAGQALVEAANTAYFDQLRVAVDRLQNDILAIA